MARRRVKGGAIEQLGEDRIHVRGFHTHGRDGAASTAALEGEKRGPRGERRGEWVLSAREERLMTGSSLQFRDRWGSGEGSKGFGERRTEKREQTVES